MEKHDFNSINEKLREHLDSSRQNWLFGAGISYESNIPLMYPLTDRVKEIIVESAHEKNNQIYEVLGSELEESAHIEHYLSHLGDLITLSQRARTKSATIGDNNFSEDELLDLYKSIIAAIGTTVRYGYTKNGGKPLIGTAEKPIVEISQHLKFIKSIYSNRANLTSRSKLTFFTTNYDTLLEDALGLEKITVVDGFSGGSIGYWNPTNEFAKEVIHPRKCYLYKLHGSIDWQRDKLNGLVRTRYGTKYLKNISDILIYPQATKYVETQKDPFSYLFSGFRNALNSSNDNVLITCGYSFGDEHINAEIESALSSQLNRTTLIAFIAEDNSNRQKVNKILDSWLINPNFGERVYAAGKKGIYYNSITPLEPSGGGELDWWKFDGLTNYISN